MEIDSALSLFLSNIPLCHIEKLWRECCQDKEFPHNVDVDYPTLATWLIDNYTNYTDDYYIGDWLVTNVEIPF